MRAAFPFSHVWMFLYEFDFSNHLIEYCGTDGTAPQKLSKFRDVGFTRKIFWLPKWYWKWPIFCTHSKYMLNAHVTCSFITANSTRLWWNLMRLQGKISVFELPTFFFHRKSRAKNAAAEPIRSQIHGKYWIAVCSLIYNRTTSCISLLGYIAMLSINEIKPSSISWTVRSLSTDTNFIAKCNRVNECVFAWNFVHPQSVIDHELKNFPSTGWSEERFFRVPHSIKPP